MANKVADIGALEQTLADIKAQMKSIQDATIPKQEATALTEDTKPAPVEAPKDYREELVKIFSKPGSDSDFMWSGNKEAPQGVFESVKEIPDEGFLHETIGAVTATAAVPELWAKDVFRCCPYPASAFWDAPYSICDKLNRGRFIKWHNDIHGKSIETFICLVDPIPGDTLHVVTVARMSCGTAGCAEPASTAPVIGTADITLEEYQCSFYICRNDMEDMVVDTITELNNELASCLDVCIDNAFIANIIGLGGTIDMGTYVMDPAYIAMAIGTMRSGNQHISYVC